MLDKYNREITYLRISVTDRCNLRCTYCMPADGIKLMSHKEILSFKEILEVVRYGAKHGINKVRITGGEPLVRKGVVDLVRMIAELPEIEDLAMTTNGVLLKRFAKELKSAGLQRVNISLDAVNPTEFSRITRLGQLEDVINGIEAAREAGLTPIKVNCVIKKSPDEENAREVSKFCLEKGLKIRYIKEMDLEAGTFSQVLGGAGGDCHICNRMRLTANGDIRPCLFSDLAYNIREMGVEEAFKAALGNKPRTGSVNTVNKFSNIGG